MAPRLKSLELHGYKTFAIRTLFEYPGMITAVVGPNGSGKSNVADSLRWVLGEQSYSLLRGRKTEDMIFSGSEFRSRAGMASATILFDNEDGWLPIDYSEVSITRRAYRDGQNEYLLNGQKVRLKEISELLAQSGLAERTYTIIGQGLVDAALSLRPEERRRFFEEAAGIGLYRRRREESLNRLSTTRRNMERVLDILSEIEPRLRSLERQAKKAKDFEHIRADLLVLLRDWYGYHWHRAQEDMRHGQEEYKAGSERKHEARVKLVEVERNLEQWRAKIGTLRSQLNDWHTFSAEKHREWEKVSRDLAVLDERQRALVEQKKNAQTDNIQLVEEQKHDEERYQAQKQECERLRSERDEAQKQIEGARQSLHQRQKERSEVEKTIHAERQKLVATETRKVKLSARLSELSSRRDSLRDTLDSHRESMQEEKEKLHALQMELDELADRREDEKREHEVLKSDLEIHLKKLIGIEGNIKDAQDEIAQFGVEKSRIRAELDVIEEAEKSLAGVSQGAKAVMQTVSKKGLTGEYKLISRELEAPVEYERAVAAVLGEYLDGVVLAAGASTEDVLSVLDEGEKGRAILLPNDVIRSDEAVPVPADKDCIGRALDLVKISDGANAVFQLLLGRAFLVNDRKAAARIAKSLPLSACAVTLTGEVFYGTGVVVAGKDSRSGVMSRARQKRELQEKIGKIDEQIADENRTIRRLELDLEDAEAEKEELEQQIKVVAQTVEKITQEHHNLELSHAKIKQKDDWHLEQMATIEKQIEKSEADYKQTNDALSGIDEEITSFENRIRDFSRKLKGLPLEEYQTEEAHWKTNLAVISRAVQDAENRLGEYKRLMENNKKQYEALMKRIDNYELSMKTLENEKGELRTSEEKLSKEIEELKQKISPAEQNLADSDKAYGELQENYTGAQQTVALAERNETQAQLELGRRKEALDNLRRKIEEDFGLVDFEYASDISGPTPLPLDGMVEQLPMVSEISPDVEEGINRLRSQLRRIGAINPEAQTEFHEVKERYDFLNEQLEDLHKADNDLCEIISELDELMKIKFKATFDEVAAEFKQMFTRLFGGGTARLILSDEDHPTETGIDIEARLPGRREQGLALLSGGERSLTAVALIFSLIKVSPTPFCVLDEVDAALDEANVGRFCDLLKELSVTTQFIVVTHNRSTVQSSDVVYGVTMGRDSASQVVSLRLDEVDEEYVK